MALSVRSAALPSARLSRHRRIFWLAAPVVLLLLVAMFAAFQLHAARDHLFGGLRVLRADTAALHHPLTLTQPATITRLQQELGQAQSEFSGARTDLGLWSPLLGHLGWVPRWGPELAAATPGADAAYYSTDAAIRILHGIRPLLCAGCTQHHGTMLARLGRVLAAAQPDFVAARADADRAQQSLNSIPGQTGIGQLDQDTAKLRQEMPLLRWSAVWLALGGVLLGERQPNHILFLWQNPAELRATGGFLGASDFITVRQGHLLHGFNGHDLPHEITSVPLPTPQELYTPESYWLFADSNWSPDFPLSARLERWFYGQDTGQWADGVVNFLDTATPDLLRAAGPLYLPAYHRWIDARTVAAAAQEYINGRYNGPVRSGRPDTIRKQFFFAVLQALVKRIEGLPPRSWPQLGQAVAGMIQRGEILLYDRRPAIETAVRALHADGAVRPGTGDYLYVVDDNRSYNKLNPYVREQATYSVNVDSSLWLDATLTIRYYVAPSPATLEGGGPYFGQWGTKHDYQDFLRVYVPRGARLRSMSGVDVWAPAGAYGATQFAGRLLVREGRHATVTIHYRIPANVFQAGGPATYRLRVQHQPGADLRSLRVEVHGLPGLTLRPAHAPPSAAYTTALALQSDAQLRLDLLGRTDPRPITLPAPPGTPDPYIPVQSLSRGGHGL